MVKPDNDIDDPMGRKLTDLLCMGVQLLGRLAISEGKAREIVGKRKNQINAYNLCDGMNAQTDIARRTKIKPGNLSNTIDRWHEHGIVFFVGQGKRKRPLHVYPIPSTQRHTK